MGQRINLAGIEDKDFSALPSGKYLVAVTGGEWKEAGPNSKAENVGKPMLNVEFTVQDDGEYQGRKVWTNLLFAESTAWRIKQFALATGCVTEDEIESGEFDFDLDTFMGAELVVQVKFKPETEKYDEGNEVKKFMSSDTPVTAGSSGGGSLLP